MTRLYLVRYSDWTMDAVVMSDEDALDLVQMGLPGLMNIIAVDDSWPLPLNRNLLYALLK